MTQKTENVNNNNTVAPLANVSLCAGALERAMNRAAHLPGMVCFYGPSGWGKSTAAAFVSNRHRAYYIEVGELWTRKKTLLAILHEMGIPAPKTMYDMFDVICEQLIQSGRPLIVDQLDYLVDKSAIEFIRDLHDGSGAAILLIGEERLPQKIEHWERFHRRILEFVPAQPSDIDDARHLAKLYAKTIHIADDLLKQIIKASRGSAGRICVNIERVRVEAEAIGAKEMRPADWGKREFFTGKAPTRKVA